MYSGYLLGFPSGRADLDELKINVLFEDDTQPYGLVKYTVCDVTEEQAKSLNVDDFAIVLNKDGWYNVELYDETQTKAELRRGYWYDDEGYIVRVHYVMTRADKPKPNNL